MVFLGEVIRRQAWREVQTKLTRGIFVGAEAQRERAVAFEDYCGDQESCCRKRISRMLEEVVKGCYGVQVQIAVVNSPLLGFGQRNESGS